MTLRHGRTERCLLVEVPVAERAPIIKRYLHKVPGARPHIPVDRHAELSAFETIAADYPVFRVDHDVKAETATTGPEAAVLRP